MNVLILGAGGFIGNHLVSHYKNKNAYVCGVDIHKPLYSDSLADEFILGDLRNKDLVQSFRNKKWDLVFHFAADMGGAGYVFTKEHDADILSNSLQITINVLETFKHSKQTIIYASSACVYPEHNQFDINDLKISEDSAYPAAPDSIYGWEKLTSERLCQSFAANYNMDNKIVRLHNVYGPYCSYNDGKEKSPAALCRKVVESNDVIKVWGDGEQIRSYLYITDMLNAIDLVLEHNVNVPVNVGNPRYITINDLARMIINISNKDVTIINEQGPIGVNARTSDNTLIESLTGWKPKVTLETGIKSLYQWIESKIIQ
jgi:nucleoside-diphosphate-sugar epimerase